MQIGIKKIFLLIKNNKCQILLIKDASLLKYRH
jgi:hypothetical protein